MRAYVEQLPASFQTAITVIRSDSDGGMEVMRSLGTPQSFPTWEPVERGEKPAPTLVVDTGVLQAIVAAAADVMPPSAAVDRHLADSIAVRDRLLTMVEKVDAFWGPGGE